MDTDNYKIAVNMLLETIEFHIEGYEMGLYETEEGINRAIESIRMRIRVVEKLEQTKGGLNEKI